MLEDIKKTVIDIILVIILIIIFLSTGTLFMAHRASSIIRVHQAHAITNSVNTLFNSQTNE